jgi:hypothetical protein
MYLAGAAVLSLAACAMPVSNVAQDEEPAFRIQTDGAAALSAALGSVSDDLPVINADAPFRLRMAARASGADQVFALEYRRNGGTWIAVEAHDYPLPKRELEMDYAAAGADLTGWTVTDGLELMLADQDGSSALRVEAGAVAGYALLASPWPLEGFSFAVEMALPEQGAASLVFGHQSPSDEGRLTLDAEAGAIRLERVRAGVVTVLAEAQAPIAPGERVLVEVQSEDGVLEVDIGDGAVVLSTTYPDGLPAEALGLHLSAGSVTRVHSIDLAGEASTPPVSLVSSPAFEHGAPAEPIFAGDVDGFAVSTRDSTPVWSAAPGAVGEFVWSLVIRRFADGALLNEDGDVFEFRMVDAETGVHASLGADPVIMLGVPDGHLGGTFVETPGRIGPFLSDAGALYFIMEPAETDNLFMMVKSEDGGRTWREVDGAGRPATGDLEGVDARMIDGTIQILHQITDEVVLHSFNTADHPSAPDQWAVTDAPVAEVEAISQMATLAASPDGGLTAVFLGDELYIATRPADGAWSGITPLDPESDALTVGPQAVAGADGAVHVAYADTSGAVRLRSIGPGGAIGARILVAEGAVTGEDDYGAVLPLVHIAESGTVVIAYRLADGTLWERRMTGGALREPALITAGPVITNAVDSQQAAAEIVAHGETLHVLFVHEETRSIFSAHECGSGWSEPVLRVDGIVGSWVRGAVHADSEGGAVYRFVYDAGSNGGSGLNRYGEIALTMCD